MNREVLHLQERVKELIEELKETKAELARAQREKKNKPKFWVPDSSEEFYYVDEDGCVCCSEYNEHNRDALEHGNMFKTKAEADLACILHRSINFQIKFAFHAGGNGRLQIGSYLLGQENILKAKPLAYPTVVYMPNEESALACWRYLKNKKWLTAG